MTKDDRLLRIGVLGCGPIAQFAHFDACRKARNATLHAICDVADDLRERMAAVHRPHVAYRDYDAMLADPEVEAVIVAIADQFHVPACLKAIEAGKHVLVEKPLGTDVEECRSSFATAPRPRGSSSRSGITGGSTPGSPSPTGSSGTRSASAWRSRPGTATRRTATR